MSNNNPVFVVGCARSGTTLLYHVLVSSGAFVNYRAETHFYDMMLPRYGSLASRAERKRLADEWTASEAFGKFGVDAEEVRSRIVEDCRTGGDVLRAAFEAAARRQGRPRWAECTPLHLLHMERIKREIPDAVFLHIIRDGRDVALSLRKVGWVNPLPWDRGRELEVAAWGWEWMVRKGRAAGRRIGEDYHEVRFEELVRAPREAVARIGRHVGRELDWDVITANPVGSVARPNTAFTSEGEGGNEGFDPIFRWKRQCSSEELASLEASIGATLSGLGYPTSSPSSAGAWQKADLLARKTIHQTVRTAKQWVKDHTALSRLFTRSYLEDV